MIPNLKKISISTIIPLIIILSLLSLGILLPIITMVIFGAILAYYVRFIAKKIHPFVKYDTLAVFLSMILVCNPNHFIVIFHFHAICKHCRYIFRFVTPGCNWKFHHEYVTIRQFNTKSGTSR